MTARIARGALVVTVLAISLVLAGRAPGAWACSCVGGISQAEHFGQAEVVFAGEVTAREDPHADDEAQSTGDLIEYTFDVASQQKGAVSDPVLVKSARDEATCGYPFKVGRRYQVFGEQRARGNVTTNTCSGTQALGERDPFTPAAIPTTGLDTTIAIVGGLVLLGTAAAIGIRSWRSTSRSRRA